MYYHSKFIKRVEIINVRIHHVLGVNGGNIEQDDTRKNCYSTFVLMHLEAPEWQKMLFLNKVLNHSNILCTTCTFLNDQKMYCVHVFSRIYEELFYILLHDEHNGLDGRLPKSIGSFLKIPSISLLLILLPFNWLFSLISMRKRLQVSICPQPEKIACKFTLGKLKWASTVSLDSSAW